MPDLRSSFEAFRPGSQAIAPTLLDAALLVARMDRPHVDEDAVRTELHGMADQAKSRLPSTVPVTRAAEGLCRYLRDTRGLLGNAPDYHAADNSFIDRVLATSHGIPITLAVIYVSVADEVGLRCEGVGFPGHFLVRVRDPADTGPGPEGVLIDPFAGRVITHQQSELMLQRLQGEGARLGPQHLRSAGAADVLVRMLANLKQLALAAGDLQHALELSQRMLWVMPGLLMERRDRAAMFEELGLLDAAIAELELLQVAVRDGAGARQLAARIEQLRQRRGSGRIVH